VRHDGEGQYANLSPIISMAYPLFRLRWLLREIELHFSNQCVLVSCSICRSNPPSSLRSDRLTQDGHWASAKVNLKMSTTSTQDMPNESSTKHACASLDALQAKVSAMRAQMEKSRTTSDAERDSGRECVRAALSALAPQPEKPQVSSNTELNSLRQLVGAISDVASQNVLTHDEADALITFITRRYVERRFDEIFRDVFTHSSEDWYLLSARNDYAHERRRKAADTIFGRCF